MSQGGPARTDNARPPRPPGGALPPTPAPTWDHRASSQRGAGRTLAQDLRLPSALCGVLAVRGFADPAAARGYLRPTLDTLHDPALLQDGERAASRILEAITRGESMLVHGDYDVDGVSSAALADGSDRRAWWASDRVRPPPTARRIRLRRGGLRRARDCGHAHRDHRLWHPRPRRREPGHGGWNRRDR